MRATVLSLLLIFGAGCGESYCEGGDCLVHESGSTSGAGGAGGGVVPAPVPADVEVVYDGPMHVRAIAGLSPDEYPHAPRIFLAGAEPGAPMDSIIELGQAAPVWTSASPIVAMEARTTYVLAPENPMPRIAVATGAQVALLDPEAPNPVVVIDQPGLEAFPGDHGDTVVFVNGSSTVIETDGVTPVAEVGDGSLFALVGTSDSHIAAGSMLCFSPATCSAPSGVEPFVDVISINHLAVTATASGLIEFQARDHTQPFQPTQLPLAGGPVDITTLVWEGLYTGHSRWWAAGGVGGTAYLAYHEPASYPGGPRVIEVDLSGYPPIVDAFRLGWSSEARLYMVLEDGRVIAVVTPHP